VIGCFFRYSPNYHEKEYAIGVPNGLILLKTAFSAFFEGAGGVGGKFFYRAVQKLPFMCVF